MLKLFKTTSPQKLFNYDCITLYCMPEWSMYCVQYAGNGYLPCNGYVPCQPEYLSPGKLEERVQELIHLFLYLFRQRFSQLSGLGPYKNMVLVHPQTIVTKFIEITHQYYRSGSVIWMILVNIGWGWTKTYHVSNRTRITLLKYVWLTISFFLEGME